MLLDPPVYRAGAGRRRCAGRDAPGQRRQRRARRRRRPMCRRPPRIALLQRQRRRGPRSLGTSAARRHRARLDVPGPAERHAVADRESAHTRARAADVNRAMLAIYQANQQAFDGNINVLRAGSDAAHPGRRGEVRQICAPARQQPRSRDSTAMARWRRAPRGRRGQAAAGDTGAGQRCGVDRGALRTGYGARRGVRRSAGPRPAARERARRGAAPARGAQRRAGDAAGAGRADRRR